MTFAFGGCGIVSAADGELRIWDVETGRTRQTFKGIEARPTDVLVRPDGGAVVIVGKEAITLFDLTSGKSRWSWACPTELFYVDALTFDPDGRRLAVAGSERTGPFARVFDARTGGELRQMEQITRGFIIPADSLAFDPTGRMLLGNAPPGIRIWSPDDGRQSDHLLNKNLGWVFKRRLEIDQFAITPDGRRLIAGGRNGCIYIVDDWAGAAGER